MIYFDTAYLAKCYLNEHGSHTVRELAAASDRVACCALGKLELTSVIHRNLREGKITRHQTRVIFNQLDSDEQNHVWTWLPVSFDLLTEASSQFRSLKSNIYLRAADALHLSCAMMHGFTEIYSNDRHLLAAAAAFNIQAYNVINDPV